MVIALTVLAVAGPADSPYHRVGPGPVIPVGEPAAGSSWTVMTARIRDANWFQWATAELTGERTVRGGGDAAPAGGPSMDSAQTRAVLVAAQLAARRTPVGGTGLQVAAPAPGTACAPATSCSPPDATTTPLRTPADLQAATVRSAQPRVLVVPRAADGTWGTAESRKIPAGRLARVRTNVDVSATAYPLGTVRGPSAGLVLALARLDALTPGDLAGGRRIAGTGAISSDGTVTTVGEIPQKVRAAAKARADVFFVPAWQEAEATEAARDTSVQVVPVRSVADAVHRLRAHRTN
ncbi:hypothetical protein BJF79_32365 [Actinomadura sp. CNU-125]|uniref:S16 family serine protease n=1 Tax=Actinomadura sp. CNU-125 TaxID=1904961 RepID=UPI00095CA45E|nr:S16 family serine protease [Actinomadura sp. CNU-125]OLT35454.1 hypothetical protein BJF79_32365 [Actinomadura sp. CNU-125]